MTTKTIAGWKIEFNKEATEESYAKLSGEIAALVTLAEIL